MPKEISGGGTETDDSTEVQAGEQKFDPVLDELNKETKNKIAPSVYSSFLHPRLKTGTLTFDRKRKSEVSSAESGQTKPTNAGNGSAASAFVKKPKTESERSKHKFQFI